MESSGRICRHGMTLVIWLALVSMAPGPLHAEPSAGSIANHYQTWASAMSIPGPARTAVLVVKGTGQAVATGARNKPMAIQPVVQIPITEMTLVVVLADSRAITQDRQLVAVPLAQADHGRGFRPWRTLPAGMLPAMDRGASPMVPAGCRF